MSGAVRDWGVFRLHTGDCLAVLREVPEASVDSVVTDPPYGLAFMGKKWDYDVPTTEVWAECLRVLKPGGHMLAFGGTRTYHRLVCAIEDAGFEVRDQIGWAFGSGFPKSHNGEWGGTALKPAWEPICLARKSLVGTVEANWREHGTGALNIDGCRVHASDSQGYAYTVQRMMPGAGQNATGKTHQEGVEFNGHTQDGRWPANLIHDGSDEVLAAFPQTTSAGRFPSNSGGIGTGSGIYGKAPGRAQTERQVDSGTGSAARFFYGAKASRADREEGLSGLPERVIGTWGGDDYNLTEGKKSTVPRRNTHPTVKPTDLMRYLCRLVTPAGGLVLDPFTGSGSTGKAATLEGFRFIGIEREAAYVDIAERRIATAVFGACAFGEAAA